MNAQGRSKRLQGLGVTIEKLERMDKSITEIKDGKAAVELALMTTEMERWKREAKNLSRKLHDSQTEVAELKDDMRKHCDVTEMECESPESRQMRKRVWNEDDSAELSAIESVYEDSVEQRELERSWAE